MFFIISDHFVVISEPHLDNHCLYLSLFDLKSDHKSQIRLDLMQSNGNEDKTKVEPKESIEYSIICGNFSADSNRLAVCDNRKQLIVFQNIDNNWKQIFKTKVARNCIKLLFSSNKNSVICGHKSGDIYEYDIESSEESSSRLLLGHCSMLLDFMQTNDTKFLISSDRDEKIRISCYPNSYNIQSYCLGHKEFVSTIDTINNQTFISGSGDGSIRLWNLLNGKQLDVLMCDPMETLDGNDKNGTQYPVKKLVTNCKTNANLLAITFYKQSIVKIYSIDSLILKPIHTLNLDKEPIHIEFDVLESDLLWVLLPEEVNAINIYRISAENIVKTNIYENIIKGLNSNETFLKQCLKANDCTELEGLYKHWFNNVETYLQKKHQRQEVLKKKKKFSHF